MFGITPDSEQEPYERTVHVRICAGGRRRRRSLPRYKRSRVRQTSTSTTNDHEYEARVRSRSRVRGTSTITSTGWATLSGATRGVGGNGIGLSQQQVTALNLGRFTNSALNTAQKLGSRRWAGNRPLFFPRLSVHRADPALSGTRASWSTHPSARHYTGRRFEMILNRWAIRRRM